MLSLHPRPGGGAFDSGAGGRVEIDDTGEEIFVIPVRPVQPSELEQSWEPGPSAGSRFSKEEMAKTDPPADAEMTLKEGMADINENMKTFAPGRGARECGDKMDPGFHEEVDGRAKGRPIGVANSLRYRLVGRFAGLGAAALRF